MSLVPSLTESLATVDAAALVGITDWCTWPAGLTAERIRGTKNPDIAHIVALAPDVVVANREENRKLDVERLRAAGVPVWVSEIDSLAEAFAQLRLLFEDVVGWRPPAWLGDAERAWATPRSPAGSVACPIWVEPWMVVGGGTFTGDLLARLGRRNVFADRPRYPRVGLAEILAAGPDLVVLPDEPHAFTRAEADAFFPGQQVALVPGRLLTWYGPSLVEAAALRL